MPDEEYQPEFEVIVMPEEVSEDEVSEQTSITIERKRQPFELIIDTRKEPEETQTEVTKTVTETVTTETVSQTVTTVVTEEESDQEFPEFEVVVMPGEKPEETIERGY